MSWFTRKQKQTTTQNDFKIYSDISQKTTLKLQPHHESISSEQLINMIKSTAMHQSNLQDLEVQLTQFEVTNNLGLCYCYLPQKRKINTNLTTSQQYRLAYQIDKSEIRLSGELCLYPGSFKFNPSRAQIISLEYCSEIQCLLRVQISINIKETNEKFDRFGTLLKRNKNGKFNEKNFKLTQDCLVYYKIDKNTKKMKYLSLDSLTVERLQIQKEKYVFQVIVDQRIYVLKAQSKTDYEGWMYSIQKQGVQVKETKLFSDYDKKVSLVQKQRMDYFKTLTTNISSSFKNILIGSQEIQNDFIKYVSPINQFDALLTMFLIETYNNQSKNIPLTQMKDSTQLAWQNRKNDKSLYVVIGRLQTEKSMPTELQKNLFVDYLDQKKQNDYKNLNLIISNFQGGLLQDEYEIASNILIQNGQQYIEQFYLSKFKSKGHLNQSLSQLPVQRYNQHMKFCLPNFQIFWTDLYQAPTSSLQSPQKSRSHQENEGLITTKT